MRGDRDVNEIKLKKALGAETAGAGRPTRRSRRSPARRSASPGRSGSKVPVYADVEVGALSDFVVGANEADAHLTGVNIGRDFTPTACGDYRTAAAGDACARCDKGHLKAYRGIEVGQVFFLGTKYSKPMGVTFLDADGQGDARRDGLLRHRRHAHRRGGDRAEPRQGRHRLAGAARAVTRSRCWTCSRTTRASSPTATRIYDELTAAGIEVLYDDRDERAGREVQGRGSDRAAVPDRRRQEGAGRGGRRGQAPQRRRRSAR